MKFHLQSRVRTDHKALYRADESSSTARAFSISRWQQEKHQFVTPMWNLLIRFCVSIRDTLSFWHRFVVLGPKKMLSAQLMCDAFVCCTQFESVCCRGTLWTGVVVGKMGPNCAPRWLMVTDLFQLPLFNIMIPHFLIDLGEAVPRASKQG